MATAPDKLLLRLEWKIVRRLDGRLQGAYRTVHRGTGVDFTGLRAYVDGDDARQIDWNVTARLDEPYLRVFTEDREVTVWLVLDRSASMTAGRPGRGKHDVLAELALVLARLFTRAGNRVGALFFDTGILRVIPPGTTRRHVLRIGAARRRSLILVLSDFIGEGDWERALMRLSRRHEVVALRIVDTADDVLPEAGLIVIEDAETGEQLIVDSADPLLRAGLRSAVDAREQRLATGMRRARVPIHRIDTDRDLTAALVEVVASTRSRSR